MRIHRIIIEPSGIIEYRITDPHEPRPHTKRLASIQIEGDLDRLMAEIRAELE